MRRCGRDNRVLGQSLCPRFIQGGLASKVGIDDMKHKRLLLLARRFPFNHGEVAAESYLENEIGLLSPCFDEILAVGTEAPEGDVPTCGLPSNVTPLALGCGNDFWDKVLFAAKGSSCPIAAAEFVRDAFASDPVRGLKQRVFRGYFAARAKAKYDSLTACLQTSGFEPTHIYSFWFYDTSLVAAWLANKYLCARAVTRAHRYDLYADRTCAHYLPFRRYILSNLATVLPCSKDGESYINRNWPGFESKVRAAYLGTRDLPDKSREPSSSNSLRIVSCSRVVDVKRVTLIAHAVTLLDSKGFRLDWTHYGDGPLMKEAKCACADLSCSNVRFVGTLPNDALLGEYASKHFDLFLNVSTSEGLPLSIMEACGCGIPVVATDVGGTHEIVADGVNGYLIPADCDVEMVVEAIKRFASLDEAERMSMRRAARNIWESRFRLVANVKDFARLLGVDGEEAGE